MLHGAENVKHGAINVRHGAKNMRHGAKNVWHGSKIYIYIYGWNQPGKEKAKSWEFYPLRIGFL